MIRAFKFAAVGSREAPEELLYRMGDVCSYLFYKGGYGASGSAEGMDTKAEDAAMDHADLSGEPLAMEIWLPWATFMKRDLDNNRFKYAYRVLSEEHIAFAEKQLKETGVVKGIDWLRENKPAIHKLFCRNVYQIFLEDKSMVDFVVYWAPENKKRKVKGGTRIAVDLARALGIPTFNIADEEDLKKFKLLTGYNHVKRNA